MRYRGTVIRPPSEARSYILQITYGCSHNQCAFCGTYQQKPFRVRPLEQVLEDIELARIQLPHTRRVFLADGDALVLSMRRLLPVLEALAEAFPMLERVGIYANARDILRKSGGELELLRQKGLGIIYLGLESGSDEVLRRMNKGATAAEMVEAVHVLKRAGMLSSVIGILGLGGRDGSAEHAEATGKAVSAMDPDYFSLLTLMLVPGTELHRWWEKGEFRLLEAQEMLSELRAVLASTAGLTECVFRTNHASNYLPLAGTLDRDSERLLATLDEVLAQDSPALRPEIWRAL